MDSLNSLFAPAALVPLLTFAFGLLWMAATVRRIVRLARYFQLEGYETPRYLRWLARTRRETRYILATIAAILFLTIPVLSDFSLFSPFSDRLERGAIGVIQAILGAAAAVLLFVALPHDRQVKQPFNPTPRARRLLGAAIVLGLLIPAFYLIMLAANLAGGATPDLPGTAYFGAMAGLLALALAPLMLPLANAAMYPVEASVRAGYLRSAKAHLKRSGAKVICITGSYGKTSTKHYLQHILSARFRSLMTPKSYNTLMGISKVINETLSGDASYEYFIVEADAYFVGENASICRLVEPQFGMVMTVGPMHLERLGSMDAIAAAQYEIIESLPADGAGFFNGDDPEVLKMAARGHPQTRVIVSHKGAPGARFAATDVQMKADGLHFTVTDASSGASQPVVAPLYGETNVTNILMAIAVAVHLGMSLAEIAPRVATLEPAEHRMVRRVLPDGTTIIDDAYSANPVGTAAALDVLKLHDHSLHRIVISSGMFELGPAHEAENRKLGERLAAAATDVILIGPKQVGPVRDGLLSQGFPADRLHVVETLDEAIAVYQRILVPGDTLLVLTDLPDTYAA
ncbi:MAG: UDP-N-acetylmuramoyl-tripeptide--D-alanyl-D-alanine ligase [Anaerolineae bacterium]|nr:UDP-N-acetylmuramoyl-tripeptide--D-alanyl-D-alanine ligase [Anaerolineae bacterium]